MRYVFALPTLCRKQTHYIYLNKYTENAKYNYFKDMIYAKK